jgi:homopolymeric O-antigen transport system ATP-binding protein
MVFGKVELMSSLASTKVVLAATQEGRNGEQQVVISVKNVSKNFKMYHSPTEKFKELFHPLKKRYHREFWALRNVSFDVKKGECLGVVGRNGAGKSTLLQVICGIFEPTNGSLMVNGNISALLELGSGFNQDLTGRENVYMNGSLRGFTKEQMDEKFPAIAAFADIGDFIEQPVKTYSSGMYVRLAFAVAINIDPEILIVDEALAVGDALFQRKCYDHLERFIEAGKTILFVTHNMMTVNQLCNRAILIDNGELILDGSAKVVTTQYERLLFARPSNARKVREEILHLSEKAEKRGKRSRVTGIGGTAVKMQEESVHLSEKAEKRGKRSHVTGIGDTAVKMQGESVLPVKEMPYLIEDFLSTSRVEYKNYDVEITDVYIRTVKGEKVNALIMNEQYVFSYTLAFNMDAEDVSVGMAMKSHKGLIVGAAASFQMGTTIEVVKKGEVYRVDWYFKCYLLPNTYFADAAVSSVIDGNRVYLNRIVDALAFKVQPLDHGGYHGVVNFDQYAVIEAVDGSSPSGIGKNIQREM